MVDNIVRGAEIWAEVIRITPLDSQGNLIPGSAVFITDEAMKVTPALVLETGDEIAVKVGGGGLGSFGYHDDIPKWATISIELVTPDPSLIATLCGGIVFSSSAEGLGVPEPPTLAALTTGGSLKAGTTGIAIAQGNAFGASPPCAEVDVATTGSTGSVVVTLPTPSEGANYMVIYGRTPGNLQEIAVLFAGPVNQATSADSGTGSVTALSVTALSGPLPAGYQFQITGDTNTPNVVFTLSQAAGEGAVSVAVDPVTVVDTIAAGDLIPVFVVTGNEALGDVPNVDDLSAGPGGGIGYQMSALGIVGNKNGVSVEVWEQNVIEGEQSPTLPYTWTVFPRCTGLHVTTTDFTNANKQTVIEGRAKGNPNWGQGPTGDFPVDATALFQDVACSKFVVPTPSVDSVASLY